MPRRLRFNRHNSDLTPKKSKHAKAAAAAAADAATASDAPIITIQSKEKTEKDELDAAKVEIMNKTEVLLEYEQLIDELKQKTHHLDHLNTEQADDIFTKGVRIGELEQEVSDCHKANELLKTISEQAIIKIDVLEGEIRMILRNHDNEIEFLIRTNAELEMRYEKLAAHRSKNVTSELAAIKSKLDARIAELNECQTILQAERAHMLEKDNECNKLLDENVSLVNQLDALKQQADDDMLAYALESHKLNSDLETEKREKTKIITELCLKAELLMEVQQELASKEADMDVERDELKNSYNVEVESVSKKFEQHMNSLNEINDMKLKELESNFTAEKITLVKEHNAAMLKLKDISQKEIDHINEMAEEKIRISEIQSEQKLMGLEASIEQAIQNEKDLWKVEIEKCQKIAETEIMQCEFEKQDLKTLLQSANDLMRQKDEKIEGLELQLVKESDSVESDLKKCQRELYNYHLTLNNTRSTVNILMERLRKSDKDVEILQMELDSMLEVKASMETQNLELSEELQTIRSEVTEYRNALIALRGSSMALERSMVEKESAFEKLLSSEEDTLDTVNQMGKLFNEKLEENIDKYAELYNDLKRKYDARETYIRDMKALLEEFATGIELARLELDLKEKTIYELMEENKNIKLETMTYKFKCEQYDFEQRVPNPSPDFTLEDVNGKSCGNDDAMVSNQLIENIINQLEKEANSTPSNVLNTELYSDEDKITVENMQLRDKVTEQMKQIELLQEMADLESSHAKENLELKTKVNSSLLSVSSDRFFFHSLIYPLNCS